MKLKIADYITIGNLLSGLVSIYFSATGEFVYAAIAIIVGVAFDGTYIWTVCEGYLFKLLQDG